MADTEGFRVQSRASRPLYRARPADQAVLAILLTGTVAGVAPATAQTALADRLTHEVVTISQVVLGAASGDGMLETESPSPWRTPWGDYLLTAGPVVQAFDSTGRYLARLDRPGQGPGELLRAAGVLFRGDSVIVFDARQPRFVVLDRLLRVHRTASLPVAAWGDVLASGDSLVVLATHIADETHLGNPYQLVDFEGRHHGSFGGIGIRYRDDRTPTSLRLLAEADPGMMWTARPTVYAFQRMGLDGTIVESFEHTPDFFPAENDGTRQPDRTPPPALVDLRQDDSGYLWLVFVVPDPRWRAAVDTSAGGLHGGRITDYGLYYDSLVEVVDPSRGAVLARRRFDPLVLSLLPPSSIGYLTYDDSAVPVVRIETLTLERRER